MTDNFAYDGVREMAPARVHFAITPSDTVDLAQPARSVYCNVAGTAVLRDGAGTNISYTLSVGQVLPLEVVRVLATGTTATVIGWR